MTEVVPVLFPTVQFGRNDQMLFETSLNVHGRTDVEMVLVTGNVICDAVDTADCHVVVFRLRHFQMTTLTWFEIVKCGNTVVSYLKHPFNGQAVQRRVEGFILSVNVHENALCDVQAPVPAQSTTR
jgi:hypothetical protein